MLKIGDCDVFYISFDEPLCESFWNKVLNDVPHAKRTHGVVGFDAAHKSCMERSDSEFFVTIDGDNIVDPRFYDITIDECEYTGCTLSWASVNHINGLIYGNGGVKLWSREFARNMRTHEQATNENGSSAALDFCWDKKYRQLNDVFSTCYPNGSPYQAFRSGFREGVKMTLHEGRRISITQLLSMEYTRLFKFNRLQTWCCIGDDVENGIWAMYGACLGGHESLFNPSFNIECISNYTDMLSIYTELANNDPYREISKLTPDLNMIGLQFSPLSPKESEWYKNVKQYTKRRVWRL